MQETIRCIKAGGLDAYASLEDPPVPGLPKGFSITVTIPPELSQQEIDQLVDGCGERHHRLIEAVHEHQHTDHRLVDEYLENYRGGG